MANDGAIWLHRKSLESWLWELPAPQFKVAMTMLLKANWKDGAGWCGGEAIQIPRGSFLTSLQSLAAATKTESIKTVRTSLANFEKADFSARSAARKGQVVLVTNFDTYQDVEKWGGTDSGKVAAGQRQGSGNDRRRKEGKKERSRAVKLSIYDAEAGKLWELQERLRKETGIRCRIRKPTPDRIKLIAQRLSDLATSEECEHVLRVYQAEARKSGSLQWFNGETHWRASNFERALGREVPHVAGGGGTLELLT